jgi:hypothetical protein
MFQFEAQTGRLLPFHQVLKSDADRAPHNFYRFVFYDAELAWVKTQVEAATIGSCGLEYPYLTVQAFHNKDLRPALDRGRAIFE